MTSKRLHCHLSKLLNNWQNWACDPRKWGTQSNMAVTIHTTWLDLIRIDGETPSVHVGNCVISLVIRIGELYLKWPWEVEKLGLLRMIYGKGYCVVFRCQWSWNISMPPVIDDGDHMQMSLVNDTDLDFNCETCLVVSDLLGTTIPW